MSDEIFAPPSYEAYEKNVNPRFPRRKDIVFCPTVKEVPIIGMVNVVIGGTVYVEIGGGRFITSDDRVEVIFRPRLIK